MRYMAVPRFDALMLPLLTIAADGKEHRLNDVVPILADRLGLSEADRAETIPSGQSRLRNRTYWAKLYLSQAKAIDTVGAGVFRINERGRNPLARSITGVTADTLMEFPEFQAFRAKSKGATSASAVDSSSTAEAQTNDTPEDGMRSAYESVKGAVVRDI